jgi:small ligand-binding sensory domain FIST
MAPFCASALRTELDTDVACREATASVRRAFGSRPVDLVVCFLTHHHAGAIEDLPARIAAATGARAIIGCTGESVVGGNREVEEGPAFSLFAAHLPGTRVRGFRAPFDGELPPLPPVEDGARASVLLLADPFSFPAPEYLERIGERMPGLPVIGGMASGGRGPGQNLVFDADGVAPGGALGVVVEGDVELRPVVSQGCRPIGKAWVVTNADDAHVLQLGGRPALDVLMETMSTLSLDQRESFQRQPFVGVAVDARKSQFARDDFLARGLLGADPRTKAIAVGDHIRRGQTIQFLIRDASSAGEDIERLLGQSAGSNCAGALLFTCNGRGTRLFEVPDHDASHVQRALGPELPLAGFFAMGEIGPVGPRPFLHGFTASLGLFVPRAR